MLNYLVKIWKQSTLEECEESEPEPKNRTMTVLKLTEGFGFIEASSNVFLRTLI
jgi:hypothetical protein